MEHTEVTFGKEIQEEHTKKRGLKMEKLTVQDLPGVGAATAEKMEQAGFKDLLSVAVATVGELVEVAGVTETVARKMINAARDNQKMGFETGIEVLQRRASVSKLSTGSRNFDSIMEWGFETGAITECFGEFGCGKTQIAHTLVVNALKEDPEAHAVFIDTENTFRPERIQQLCKGANVDPNEVLNRIMVARAYNSDHQMLLAEKAETIITEQGKKVRLVIVDSLTSHFRA